MGDLMDYKQTHTFKYVPKNFIVKNGSTFYGVTSWVNNNIIDKVNMVTTEKYMREHKLEFEPFLFPQFEGKRILFGIQSETISQFRFGCYAALDFLSFGEGYSETCDSCQIAIQQIVKVLKDINDVILGVSTYGDVVDLIMQKIKPMLEVAHVTAVRFRIGHDTVIDILP